MMMLGGDNGDQQDTQDGKNRGKELSTDDAAMENVTHSQSPTPFTHHHRPAPIGNAAC